MQPSVPGHHRHISKTKAIAAERPACFQCERRFGLYRQRTRWLCKAHKSEQVQAQQVYWHTVGNTGILLVEATQVEISFCLCQLITDDIEEGTLYRIKLSRFLFTHKPQTTPIIVYGTYISRDRRTLQQDSI